MVFADLRAVAPAHVPEGSVLGWLLLAALLVGLLAAGVFLTARR